MKHTNNHTESRGANAESDIVEVIGKYVQLKRVGKVLKGRCPFHVSDGKGLRQTLVVWPETQTFTCFKSGCKANTKSRRLGRRQGVLDFLELIEEIPADSPVEPVQEEPQAETGQESVDIPETLPLPFMEPKPVFSRVSYSMLESYQLCPLRFKQQTSRTTFRQRLGLSVHSTFHKFYGLAVQDRTPSKLRQLLDENWQSSPHSAEEDAYWHEQAHEMIEALYHSEGPLTNSIYLEKSFKFPVGDFVVSGRVDRIDKISSDQYEVIDYKVLEEDPRDEQEAIDSLQSICLYFGTHRLLGAFPIKVTYLHVDTGLRVSFSPVKSDMEKGLSRIKNLVREMREATDFPATRNRFCSACQLHGRCPATR